MEEGQEDDVEGVEGLVVDEGDNAQEGDDLDGHADAVDDVRLETLEDTTRLRDGSVDRGETLLSKHDVGSGLGGIGGAGDGDADLRLGESGRVVNTVAGHADDLAHSHEHGNNLVLVLGHHLREAVGGGNEVVTGSAGGPERGVGQDVGAKFDLAGELLGNVQVVAGDHLHVDGRLLDGCNGFSGVVAGGVHDREGARVLHGAAILGNADGDRLVTRLAEGSVRSQHLGRDVLIVIHSPLLAAVALGLEHLGDDTLSNANLLSGRLMSVVGHRALDDGVEAVVSVLGVIGQEIAGGLVNFVLVPRDHLGICLVDGAVDGVVLVGGVGGKGAHCEHFLAGEAVEARSGLVVDGHLGSGERAGLVGAQDNHRCDLLEGGEVGDDAALLGHLLGTNGEGDLHNHGKSNGHGGDGEREGHLEHLGERDAAETDLVDEQGTDGNESENDEDATGHNDLTLENAHVLAARLLDRLRRLADHRVEAGLSNESLALANLADRAGPELLPGARLALAVLAGHGDGQRLTGERGLVDRELVALDPFGISRDDIATADEDDIAGHNLDNVERGEGAVALDRQLADHAILEGGD
mmetsp:Transcript_5554/g.11590  ORF Transcript_5554/g.11590 Transcript_5554/m.11590 type:complete len:582 (-) Transcript_5554:357-2102(-)